MQGHPMGPATLKRAVSLKNKERIRCRDTASMNYYGMAEESNES